MTADLIRIFSDVHYGERASRVRTLAQLRPLCEGPGTVILNGDTLDTRAGPDPEFTLRCRAEARDFFAGVGTPVTFLTGNHDPDISTQHACELAGGQVWATHGDIIFDDMVPWGRDAPLIRRRIRAALAAAKEGESPAAPAKADLSGAALAEPENPTLEERFHIWRQIALSTPQRHQSEQNGLKYTVCLAIDLIWPPWRLPHMLAAWQSQARRTAALTQEHRPQARFVLVGHTHRPGVWRAARGTVVINTGSLCRPLGALLVDLSPGRLVVRRIRTVRGEFHPGAVIREFALAGDGIFPQARPS